MDVQEKRKQEGKAKETKEKYPQISLFTTLPSKTRFIKEVAQLRAELEQVSTLMNEGYRNRKEHTISIQKYYEKSVKMNQSISVDENSLHKTQKTEENYNTTHQTELNILKHNLGNDFKRI